MVQGAIEGVELVTVKEIAKTLRSSEQHVLNLIHAGQLPYIRIGRAFRVGLDDFRTFLKTRRRSGQG